jgi:hypothetical protein
MAYTQINDIKLRWFFGCLFALFIGTIVDCFAHPWLQRNGDFQVINQGFVSNENYVNPTDQNAKNYNLNGLRLNTYVEYGFSNRVTLGLSSFFGIMALNNKQTSKQEYSTTDLQFVELFVRNKVLQYKNFIWSTQATLKTPGSYTGTQNNYIYGTLAQTDIEARTSLGISFNGNSYGIMGTSGSSYFIAFDFAYRQRFGLPFNELRFELLFGAHLGEHLMAIFTFQKIVNIYQDGGLMPLDNSPQSGVWLTRSDMNRLQLSLITKMDSMNSISISFFYDIPSGIVGSSANNTGFFGISLGWWINGRF